MTTNHQDDLGSSPGGLAEHGLSGQAPPVTTTGPGTTSDATSDATSGSGAQEKAREAAGTAADQAGHVAGVAQDEARNVASEAKDQVHGLLDEATSQVEEQTRSQKSRLSETLRGVGDDLHGMADQQDGSGPAHQLVRQASEQARSLAAHLDDREPRELLDDVRRFARQRPGTFLLGALAAGVVAGRLARGAKAAKDQEGTSSASPARPPVTTEPRTVRTVGPSVTSAPIGAGALPEPTEAVEPLGEPGPGRDELVEPLDPADRPGLLDPLDPSDPAGPGGGAPRGGGRG